MKLPKNKHKHQGFYFIKKKSQYQFKRKLGKYNFSCKLVFFQDTQTDTIVLY